MILKEKLMNWREKIIIDPEVLAGKPIIKGTRISVEFIVDLLGRGWSIERILKEYDHLKRDDIQACLAYAGQVLKSERVYLFPEKGAAGADISDLLLKPCHK